MLQRLCFVPLLAAAVFVGQLRAVTVVVSAGFNDQSGLDSDPTPNSPYTLGATVDGRGIGEPGWMGGWFVNSGGVGDAPQLASVQPAAAYEGDGGLSIIGTTDGSWLHRPFTPQVGRFTIQQYINVRSPLGSFGSRPADDRVGSPPGIGPNWYTSNGFFHVTDGDGGGGGTDHNTAIGISAGLWYKVDEEIDTASSTWEFFVNDKRYVPPSPLHFRGNPTSISNIDYLTGVSTYVDAITISQQNPADLNHDGKVGFDDLVILARNYGSTHGTYETGDIDGDGKVDFTDLVLLARQYGKGDPVQLQAFEQAIGGEVPEPNLLPLVLSCGGILLRPRRRGGADLTRPTGALL